MNMPRVSLMIGLVLVSAACSLERLDAQAKAHAKKDPAFAAAVASARMGAEQITAGELKAYDEFLASDELQGRDTPSPGLNIAANFVAADLASWGLKPIDPSGTYFQQIPLQKNLVNSSQTEVEVNGVNYSPGADFAPVTIDGQASGPLFYAGDGWVTAALNPYQKEDIRNKIVVMMEGGPKGGYNALFASSTINPYEFVQSHGAKALIVVPNLGLHWGIEHLEQRAFESGDISIPALSIPGSVPFNVATTGGVAEISPKGGLQIPMIIAFPSLVSALFQNEKLTPAKLFDNGTSNPGQPFEFNSGKTVSIAVKVKSETVRTQNVVALLEGSDPQLKSEYVVIGAHYDHLGVQPPERGVEKHRIYNGADDNASGSAGLMAIARAFALAPRPKRSILFVWYTGEEKGEWGSKFITKFSPVPLDSIVVQLNMDMISRTKQPGDVDSQDADLSGPGEVYVSGSKLLSDEIGQISEAVNGSFLNLKLNYHFDDPQNRSLLTESDDYPYLQHGIPIVYYFTGFHADYHSVADTPDKVDSQKMEQVARTVYATARAIANLPHRPRVDHALPSDLVGN